MKDLLSKERYCYKIPALLTKSSAYPSSIDNPLYGLPPCMSYAIFTAQKTKFSIKDFSSKYDQIRRALRIWSHLQEKSLMENFIFCAVLE